KTSLRVRAPPVAPDEAQLPLEVTAAVPVEILGGCEEARHVLHRIERSHGQGGSLEVPHACARQQQPSLVAVAEEGCPRERYRAEDEVRGRDRGIVADRSELSVHLRERPLGRVEDESIVEE